MAEWVKIRSWHLQKPAMDKPRFAGIQTLCGRWADPDAEQTDDRPQGKTCETCLRIKVGR